MKYSKKILLPILILILAATTLYAVSKYYKFIIFSAAEEAKNIYFCRYSIFDNGAIDKAANIIKERNPQRRLIDAVRNSIHSSLDPMGPLDRQMWYTYFMATKLVNFFKTGEKLHINCGPSALLMEKVLDKLHIKSRIVSVYSDKDATLKSHTFLDVYNDKTKRWEAQDPLFNLQYINKDTDKKMSVVDLISTHIDKIEPVIEGKCTGWKACNVDFMKNFLGAAIIWSPTFNERPVAFLNRERFDPEKNFKKNIHTTFQKLVDIFSSEDHNNFYDAAKLYYSDPFIIN